MITYFHDNNLHFFFQIVNQLNKILEGTFRAFYSSESVFDGVLIYANYFMHYICITSIFICKCIRISIYGKIEEV